MNAICGIDFKRRSATRDVLCVRFRGLKPTATVTGSLRDRDCRRAANEGSRAFQRPDQWTIGDARRVVRRGATSDGSRGFQPTGNRAPVFIRRGATGDLGGWATRRFNRRSATRDVLGFANRGLKPTATVTGSLRDREAVALAKKIQKNFEELGV